MSGTRESASPDPKRPGPKRRRAKGEGDGGATKFDWRKLIQRVLVIGIACVLVLCAIFYFAYKRTTIPTPNAAYQAQATYVYYNNGKSKLGSFATQNRETIPLSEIPESMQDAVVAAEDRTFWTNHGVDPKGILRAAFSNAQGNATQGASTITQQYVKILYLNQERTLKRKIKEAFLSLKVQQEESKQRIMAGYLNTIYFGRSSYGVQAAAEAWFGEPAKDLKPQQSAMLAAIVNSPSYLDPKGSAEQRRALLDRYQYVLDGMVTAGKLDSAKAERFSKRLPKVIKEHATNQYGGQKGFMLSLVKAQLLKMGFTQEQIDGGGLRVTTTFNRKVMAADQDAVDQVAPDGVRKLHVGVASVDVKTGALLGFYAGQDYLKSQIDYATHGGSVGSTFKPFAVAAALKQGFSLKSTFDGDSPYEYKTLPGQEVHNEGEASGQANGQSYGPHISLTYALQQSVNTAFANLTDSLNDGPRAIKRTARAMGVPKSADVAATPNIALGSATIAPVDMANSYSTIADGGLHHDWYVVKKVTRAYDGKTLYKAKKKTDRVLSEDVADDTSYAMQQVVKGGTGRSALGLGRSAAGKTGTATNADDDVDSSWFIGFTPQVSTAVMYIRGTGHASLEGYLVPYYGASYPAQTWTAAMRSIMDGMPVEEFPPAANVSGTPPTTGHAPYTPPPPPPKQHHKKPKPSKTQSSPSKPSSPSSPGSGPSSPHNKHPGGGKNGGNGKGGGGGGNK